MQSSKKIFPQFVSADFKDEQDLNRLERTWLTKVFSIAIIVTLLISSLFNELHDKHILALFNLGFASVFALNLVVLYKHHSLQFVSRIILALLILILNGLLISGGPYYSGLFWFFIFPPLAFFLSGQWQGLFWIASMVITTCLTIFLGLHGYLPLNFELPLLYAFAPVFFLVNLFAYLYQHINDGRVYQLNHIAQDLEHSNTNLAKQDLRELELETELKASLQNMQQRNKELEETKKATLNILEDLQSEKEMLETEKAKDEALLLSIPDGVVVVDRQGNLVLFNSAAEQLFGFAQHDIIGKPFYDILRMEDENGKETPNDKRPLTQALKYQTTVTALIYYQRHDGSRFPASVTIAPIRLNGEIIGAIQITRDVTNEKLIDKAKTQFVSLASHQLRTPLTSIRWYSEMLLSGQLGTFTKEQREYLQAMYDSSVRMANLVNALLSVSQIESGALKSKLTIIDIEQTVYTTLEEFKNIIEQKKLHINTHFEHNLPPLQNDSELLSTTLRNVISNAVTYTPQGGSIRLSLEMADNGIRFVVSDTGYGIPKAQRNKIFSKLFRADNIQIYEPNGSGLGLYITKGIMDYMGGTISFTSEENKGTTFSLLFPLSLPSGTNTRVTTSKT